MGFINKRTFAGGVTKITGAAIVHFIIGKQSGVKHGFEIGGFV